MTEHFTDRVLIQVTTTPRAASEILEDLEIRANYLPDPDRTTVCISTVEKPEILKSVPNKENPNEDSWS